MRENDNEEQGGGCDIDFASILLEIEPGYIVLADQARGSKILFVPRSMESPRGLRPASVSSSMVMMGCSENPCFSTAGCRFGTWGTWKTTVPIPLSGRCCPSRTIA